MSLHGSYRSVGEGLFTGAWRTHPYTGKDSGKTPGGRGRLEANVQVGIPFPQRVVYGLQALGEEPCVTSFQDSGGLFTFWVLPPPPSCMEPVNSEEMAADSETLTCL